MRRAGDISLKASKLLDCPCSTGWAQGWCVLKALRARHFLVTVVISGWVWAAVSKVLKIWKEKWRQVEVLWRRRHEWSKRHYLRQRTLCLGQPHPSKKKQFVISAYQKQTIYYSKRNILRTYSFSGECADEECEGLLCSKLANVWKKNKN